MLSLHPQLYSSPVVWFSATLSLKHYTVSFYSSPIAQFTDDAPVFPLRGPLANALGRAGCETTAMTKPDKGVVPR